MSNLTVYEEMKALDLPPIVTTNTVDTIRLGRSGFNVTKSGETVAYPELTCIILQGNWEGTLSKRWFKDKYNPENASRPDCASANGITPDSTIENPCNSNCANCPNNVWVDNRAPVCSSYKRLVVIMFNEVNGDLYRLDVPKASLNNMKTYNALLSTCGYKPYEVITRLTNVMERNGKLEYSTIQFEPYERVNNKIVRMTPEQMSVVSKIYKSNEETIRKMLYQEVSARREEVEEEEEKPVDPKPAKKARPVQTDAIKEILEGRE